MSAGFFGDFHAARQSFADVAAVRRHLLALVPFLDQLEAGKFTYEDVVSYAADLGLEGGQLTTPGVLAATIALLRRVGLALLRVGDAVRLGCAAIGFTIYPGSDQIFEQMEEIRELSEEAKAVGIATVIWSYPRGGKLSKDGELALDVGAYAAHMAALLGAHIIKVKLPSAHIEQEEAKKAAAEHQEA